MTIELLSTSSLRMLHDGITRAMATDDAHPGIEKPYGVRHYRDWRRQADSIEAELVRRRERHMPLAW